MVAFLIIKITNWELMERSFGQSGVWPHESHLSVLQGFHWPFLPTPTPAGRLLISYKYLRGLSIQGGLRRDPCFSVLVVNRLCLPRLTACLWLYAPATVSPKSSRQLPHVAELSKGCFCCFYPEPTVKHLLERLGQGGRLSFRGALSSVD